MPIQKITGFKYKDKILASFDKLENREDFSSMVIKKEHLDELRRVVRGGNDSKPDTYGLHTFKLPNWQYDMCAASSFSSQTATERQKVAHIVAQKGLADMCTDGFDADVSCCIQNLIFLSITKLNIFIILLCIVHTCIQKFNTFELNVLFRFLKEWG